MPAHFTIRQLVDDNLNAKVGEYAGLVHGNIMEQFDDTIIAGGTGVCWKASCYQGLKQPRIDAGRDAKVLAYVTNPPPVSHLSEQGGAASVQGSNSVFVTYAELFADGLERDRFDGIDAGIEGVVHFWEWVLSSDRDRALPADARTIRNLLLGKGKRIAGGTMDNFLEKLVQATVKLAPRRSSSRLLAILRIWIFCCT